MNLLRPLALIATALLLVACKDDLPPTEQYVTFKGVVTDAVSGKPVSGATVTVDTVLTATTADDGTFTVANVPHGEVDYVVSVNGYQTISDHVHADPLTTATVAVKLTPLAPPRPAARWKFGLRTAKAGR